MKRNILIASLTLNVVLIAMMFSGLSGEQELEVSQSALTGDETGRLQPDTRKPEDGAPPNARKRPLAWSAIESSDYVDYIRNLREAGCPDETIRDIVIADIDQLMLSRWRERFPPLKAWRYWEPRPDPPAETSARARFRHQLRVERARMLHELVGLDATRADARELRFSRNDEHQSLDFLPQAKRVLVMDWRGRATIAERELAERSRRTQEEPATREAKRRDLEAKQLRELNALLTPDEARAYHLRYSTLAEQLRESLKSVEMTESEFQRAFDLFAKRPGALSKYFNLGESGGALDDPFLMPRLQEALGQERLQALHAWKERAAPE